MPERDSTGQIVTPNDQRQQTARTVEGLAGWLQRWPWYRVWQRLQAGKEVSAFELHWTLLSLERRAGRLRKRMSDQEAPAWVNPWRKLRRQYEEIEDCRYRRPKR